MIEKWAKTIAHVDMDAFFAAVEQRDDKSCQKKPVAVVNGQQGSSIIARSYEARYFGISTCMRSRVARRLCPGLIIKPARPEEYQSTSQIIMDYLHTITPDIEIFSIDEAFLDLTHCSMLYPCLHTLATNICDGVLDASGVSCSVGISGDKTTAKWASKYNKPQGIYIVPPHRSADELMHQPVSALCGIGQGIANFLAQYNVYTCGEITKIPMQVLSQRFGDLGRRVWLMCQGLDPTPVRVTDRQQLTLGNGKVLPPATTSQTVVLAYFANIADKVAKRLRRHKLLASKFYIGYKCEGDWIYTKTKSIQATDDATIIFRLAKSLVLANWSGQGVYQCQITAISPHKSKQQDMFLPTDKNDSELKKTCDELEKKFGANTIKSATCLNAPQVFGKAASGFREK